MHLHIGQITLPIRIEYTSRSSIGLTVTENKTIRIRAPKKATEKEIIHAANTRKPWVLKTLRKIEEEQPKQKPKEYISGQKLRYKGRRYTLKTNQGKQNTLTFQNFIFTLTYTEPNKKTQIVQQWFTNKAKRHLTKRAQYYINQIEPAPKKTEVEPMRAWGKYKENKIKLHPRLIHAPQRIIDYVIVHECIHAKHNHHGQQFWRHVKMHVPDYKERKEWLRKNGNLLQP